MDVTDLTVHGPLRSGIFGIVVEFPVCSFHALSRNFSLLRSFRGAHEGGMCCPRAADEERRLPAEHVCPPQQ